MAAVKSPLRTLSRETAIYGVSNVVGKFLNFLLVPFYVNVLPSTVDYGFVSSLYAYIGFLAVIFPLGMEGAYLRYAARAEGARGEPEAERRLFSSPFWLIFAFGLAAAAAIWAAAPALVGPAFGDPKHDLAPVAPMLAGILRNGAVILFFDALAIVPFAAMRLEHRAKTFAAIKIGNIAAALVLNFVFVLRLGWGVAGIFRANAIVSLATAVVAVAACPGKLGFRWDSGALRRMVPFGLWNIPAYFGAMLVQVVDRPIVQRILGLDTLGVYQANYRMGIAMMVLVSVFDYAWRPFFLRQYATRGDDARPLFARVFSYTTLLSLIAFLGLAFFLPWFVGVRLPLVHRSLLRGDYLSGTGIIPVVLLAYVFQGFYTNFIVGIYVREKTKWLPLVTGLGAATNIAANLYLIPRYGILGAAYATLAAYFVMAGSLYVVAQRFFPIRYEWGRLARLAGVVLLAYAAGAASGRGWVQALAVVSAVPALFAVGFFHRSELESMRGLFRLRATAPAPELDPVAYAREKERDR
jgi:O-antigen/teichoic acid export membrane protein